MSNVFIEIKPKSGCLVHAHPAGKARIEDVDSQSAERPVPGFHALVGGSVGVDRILENNGSVDCGEGRPRVIFTPGHSKCSLSFLCDEEGILFTGDAIPQADDLPIYDDAARAVESIRRLKQIKGVKALLSSWREPSLDEDPYGIMDHSIESFQRIHSTVRAVSAGKRDLNPMELCSAVVSPWACRHSPSTPWSPGLSARIWSFSTMRRYSYRNLECDTSEGTLTTIFLLMEIEDNSDRNRYRLFTEAAVMLC